MEPAPGQVTQRPRPGWDACAFCRSNPPWY